MKQIGENADKQFEAFAKASRFESPSWIQMQPDQIDHTADVLIALFNRLNAYISSAKEAGENKKVHPRESIPELRHHIIKMLVQTPGQAAHNILTRLAEDNKSNQEIRDWLLAERTKHAAQTAQAGAGIEPEALHNIGSIFQTNPKSEAQLFHQVLARLEEIKKGIEEGPFSERCLFWPGMPEKDLQHWLAAKLQDTQNRRFTVIREPEVDNDKEPDIQLGCQHGKVCIEIKPADETRSYAANSLTNDTLRRQLVEQYLKGDSQHGVLMLFRLDEKNWDIPDGEKKEPFSLLIDYLQRQADILKASSPNVQKLDVIGIDCVAPKKNEEHCKVAQTTTETK
ncbi:MAG: hypothetical protein D3910_20365 [Candidatus Electrothrix sp. ATG2]|nr:hypothetical protein [Candidatus Electrothrix sp. ATG2]